MSSRGDTGKVRNRHCAVLVKGHKKERERESEWGQTRPGKPLPGFVDVSLKAISMGQNFAGDPETE